MQIYADVTGRPIKISRSAQTCALGAAIAGAVVAGKKSGGYEDIAAAQKAMTGLRRRVFTPDAKAHAIYTQLYVLYRKLHDAFGTTQSQGSLFGLMKELIAIRNQVRS
jgi:L-ribulokinase